MRIPPEESAAVTHGWKESNPRFTGLEPGDRTVGITRIFS